MCRLHFAVIYYRVYPKTILALLLDAEECVRTSPSPSVIPSARPSVLTQGLYNHATFGAGKHHFGTLCFLSKTIQKKADRHKSRVRNSISHCIGQFVSWSDIPTFKLLKNA